MNILVAPPQRHPCIITSKSLCTPSVSMNPIRNSAICCSSSSAVPTARTKPCKGMMGLVEEGQEVMAEGEEKEDALADLALIGAAQRVEHYEISGYTTAKNLAQQARHSAVVALLSKSLAEEECRSVTEPDRAQSYVGGDNAGSNRAER